MDLRALILDRLDEIGEGPAYLADHADRPCSRSVIYRYLRGEGEISAATAGWMLEALDIELRPRRRRKTA